MYHSIRPGKTWYDTDGKRIQAHGGSILYADGVFYWYGENKEGITGTATGEKCAFWHHGVRLYSSRDLYNWKDEGCIVPESADAGDPFHPANVMDRPHILFNEHTGKFVLWTKTARNGFESAQFSVCVGDSLFSLRYVGDVDCAPMHAGDFDLFVDVREAYVVYENPHKEMILQRLKHDYTGITGDFSVHLPAECPPFVREAPAFFTHDGRRFLLTSGTTGYYPNPTVAYDITAMHGTWESLGEVCVNDRNRNSFHAQFSSVFRHPHRENLYIALGDRWLTDLPEDLPDMEQFFYNRFSANAAHRVDASEKRRLSDENTSEADYVWLPIEFDDNGNPHIKWLREWRVEDYR